MAFLFYSQSLKGYVNNDLHIDSTTFFFSTNKEKLYKIQNPFCSHEKAVVKGQKGYYKPHYVQSTNEFVVWCEANEIYQLQLSSDITLMPKMTNSFVNTRKERKVYKYDLISDINDDHWFSQILKPNEKHTETLKLGHLDVCQNNMITFHLYNFGEGPSSIKYVLNGFQRDTTINHYGDFSIELNLNDPIISKRNVTTISLSCENNELGIIEYQDLLNRSRIDYSGDYSSYQTHKKSNIKFTCHDDFDYYILIDEEFVQINADSLFSANNMVQNSITLFVQRYGGYEKLNLYPTFEIPPVKDKTKFIIISHPNFATTKQSFLNLLEVINPEMDVKWVYTQAIYDKYNLSSPSAFAIKKYLHESQPNYVLLLGDANVNETHENDLVPTFYYKHLTLQTRTSSDYIYSYLDDPGDPQFVISRLPFSKSEQVFKYLERVYKYIEDANNSPKINLVNAQPEVHSLVFSKGWENIEVEENLSDIFTEIDLSNNQTLVYFGHGAFNGWGQKRKFTSHDWKNNHSSEPLVLLDFTCWTGDFSHAKRQCFTEQLLDLENGPISVISPSNFISIDTYIYIFPLVQSYRGKRIGDLWKASKKNLSLNRTNINDMHSINLFGIPTLNYY